MANTYSAPGIVIVDIAGHTDTAQDIVVQPDGSLLIAGFSDYGRDFTDGFDFSLARLSAAGAVDTDYGHAGREVIHKQIPYDKAYSLQVQDDGAVVAAHAGHDDTPIIQRWGVDGKADTAFNSNAQASLPSGLGAAPIVSARADGSVLVGAAVDDHLNVSRLNPDGTLDTSFGSNGLLTLQASGTWEFVENITVLDDGGVLVQGAPGFQSSVSKYTASGELDTQFGENGVASLAGFASYRGDLAVQADGKILIASTSTFNDFAVLRLNADGSRDTSFGNNGLVSIDLPGDSAQADGISVLSDGKIVLGGNTYALGGSDYAAVRLNADGSLDTTFASPDGNTRLVGSSAHDALQGLAADEMLRGLAGDDLLQGNLGRDLLSGGAGADVFSYALVADSFRTATSHSDRILDFNPSEDRIDVSALGFSGIGDGYNGTLAIQSNAEGSRTYLKSFEANADGQRFELVLDGDLANQLTERNVLFSSASGADSPQLVALGVQPELHA